MRLRDIAHSRAGDKGNISNLSLIAFHAEDYALLERHVTAERVRAHFAGIVHGEVVRYALPQLGAMNFVIDGVLDGGVNDSLNLDAHGKVLSFHLLAMKIRVPAAVAQRMPAKELP